MKRKSIIVLISLLALLLAVPIWVQAAAVGKFTSVEGKVDVTPPGKAALQANLGDELNVGDIIRTKSKSKCEVALVDGSILRLAESSRLRITEFVQEKEQRNAVFNLFRGKIQNIVKTTLGAAGAKSKYEVHTPTAVVGVRGTNFFTFFQSGISGAVFKEGQGYGYSLHRPAEVRTIAAGQAMLVTSPDLPPVIKAATDVELNQHEKDTAPAEKPKEKGEKEKEKAEAGRTKAEEGQVAGKTGEKESESAKTAAAGEQTQGPAAGAPPAEVSGITTATLVEESVSSPLATAAPAEAAAAISQQTRPPTQPVVPPVEVVQTSLTGQVSGRIFNKDYSASIEGGSFSALVADAGEGTMSASGTVSNPLAPAVLESYIEGTSDKGGVFYGLLGGVSGSWLNRASALYVEGENVYFLTGDGTGSLTETTYSMNGSLNKSAAVGTITLVPGVEGNLLDALHEKLSGCGGCGYSPMFFAVDSPYMISDSGIQITPDIFDDTAPCLITNEGKRVAAVGNIYAGAYSPSAGTFAPYLGSGAADDYSVGSLSYSHDSVNHHFSIDALLRSISKDHSSDAWYLGSYSMRYLGTYDPAAAEFRMAGAGTYEGTPAAFGSAVGVLDNNGFKYYNSNTGTYESDNPITGLTGLLAGTTDLWTAPADFTMIGKYSNPKSRTVWFMDIVSKDLRCGGSNCACNLACQPVRAFGSGFAGVGYRGGIIGGSRDNILKGLGIALYSKPTATAGVYEAGYLKLESIKGLFYSDIGMWEAAGTISAHPMGTTSVSPDLIYDGSSALDENDFMVKVGDGAISGMLEGMSVGFDDVEWDVAVFGGTGTYTAVPTGAWSAKTGKVEIKEATGSDPYWERNFFLGTLSGDAWDAATGSFTASMNGREMYAKSDGYYYILNLINVPGIVGRYSDGTYDLMGSVVPVDDEKTSTPLTFVSDVTADVTYWNGTDYVDILAGDPGSMRGLMGGTDSLWTASKSSPIPLNLLGDYAPTVGKPSYPSLFVSETKNFPYQNEAYAYHGYVGGLEMNNTVTGKTYALFVGPSDTAPLSVVSVYPAGILVGQFTGGAYPDIDMWEGNGEIYPVYLAEVSTSPSSDNFAVHKSSYDTSLSSPGISFKLNSANLSNGSFSGERLGYNGGNEKKWGVWMSSIGGPYTGSMADSWTGSVEYIDATSVMGREYAGTKWSDNRIEGTTIGNGAQADPDNAYSWISVGEALGTFDPTNSRFMIGAMGVALETNTFLNLTLTDDGRAKLQALNIPAVHVGTADLSWSDVEAIGLTSVNMNNVRFFATSTGQAPQIWATNAVSGSYSGTPVPITQGGTPVTLSGSGLTAGFGVTNWDATNNVWAAKVTDGSGALPDGNAYTGNINFKGAAAGTINAASGTFGAVNGGTGTAAGVAKPAP